MFRIDEFGDAPVSGAGNKQTRKTEEPKDEISTKLSKNSNNQKVNYDELPTGYGITRTADNCVDDDSDIDSDTDNDWLERDWDNGNNADIDSDTDNDWLEQDWDNGNNTDIDPVTINNNSNDKKKILVKDLSKYNSEEYTLVYKTGPNSGVIIKKKK